MLLVSEGMTAPPHYLNGLPIFLSRRVPLTIKDPLTGEDVAIAAITLGDGRLQMHPVRFAELKLRLDEKKDKADA